MSSRCIYVAVAALFAAPAVGSAQTIDPLVRISTGTVFTKCTADQVSTQPGTNFPGSAIEPGWRRTRPAPGTC